MMTDRTHYTLPAHKIACLKKFFRDYEQSIKKTHHDEDGFDRLIEIEQFVGRWYALPPPQCSRLGAGQLTLGRDALVGERVWQCNLRIRIHIGPLPRARYLAFLPGGELAAALARLLSLAAGGQFEYEIRPILRAADVTPCMLGAATGCRLGHDSFVLTRPAAADRCDLAYLAPFSD